MRQKSRDCGGTRSAKSWVSAGQPAWYRVNELWFDSVKAAIKAFNSQIAADCTNDLMPRVKDFTPVFVKDMEIKLPSSPKKGKTTAKGKGGKKK